MIITKELGKSEPLFVTHDWPSGLLAALYKSNRFDRFKDIKVATFNKNPKFFHIIHNLDQSYEGRIKLNSSSLYFPKIHGLDPKLLINETWNDPILNPSRSLLLTVDQWATVSPSYKKEILSTSPLKDLLSLFPRPFSQSNGVNVGNIQNSIKDVFGGINQTTHLQAKEFLQKEYFGMKELDESKVLFSTIGRMVQQKGIKLILSVVQYIIHSSRGRAQFIIAGNISPGDPYGLDCANHCKILREKYPQNFWADPNYFFRDHRYHLLHGSDFGLLCSFFEPGGLVQLEYLAAHTPVLATYTGGLKDTLKDFDPHSGQGTGYFIEQSSELGLVHSLNRAFQLFDNKTNYFTLRNNCSREVIDTSEMVHKYVEEFYRVMNKFRIA